MRSVAELTELSRLRPILGARSDHWARESQRHNERAARLGASAAASTNRAQLLAQQSIADTERVRSDARRYAYTDHLSRIEALLRSGDADGANTYLRYTISY